MDAEAPALHPELVEISSLTLDPKNARKHNERNLGVIGHSLGKFQQVKPIVVYEPTRVIIAGNGTLSKAIGMGASQIVAVFVDKVRGEDGQLRPMTEADAAELAIIDNRSAELAEWDAEQLAATIAEQPELNWGEVGFEPADFEAFDVDWPIVETTTVGEHERELPAAPEDFPEYDDETIETEYQCPKCAYEWSGKPKASPPARQPGKPRTAPRDGDKRQARRRIQTLIQNGTLPKPSDVLCVDCEEVPGREYDHHLGYGAEHHEDVEAVCAGCHHVREAEREKAST